MGKYDILFQGAQKTVPSQVQLDNSLPPSTKTKWVSEDVVDEIIDRASKKYGIDKREIKGILESEAEKTTLSSGKKMYNAASKAQTSSAGGLMQIIDDTAKSLGITDKYDPEQSIMGGTAYLKQLKEQFGGDSNKAIVAYFKGPGMVQTHGLDVPGTTGGTTASNYLNNVQSFGGLPKTGKYSRLFEMPSDTEAQTDPVASEAAPKKETPGYGKRFLKALGEEFLPVAQAGMPATTERMETSKEQTEKISQHPYLQRALIDIPLGTAKTGAAIVSDVTSPITRGLAALTGKTPADVNAHPLRSLPRDPIGNMQKSDNYLKRATANLILEATRVENYTGFGLLGKIIGKGAPAATQQIRASNAVNKYAKSIVDDLTKANAMPGKTLEAVGKSNLKSAMKIKDPTAKLAARYTDDGVKKIVDDISKYDVESPGLGFRGIINKSQKVKTEYLANADKIIDEAVKNNPGQKVDIESVFLNFMDDAKNGTIKVLDFGDEDKAIKIADEIFNSPKMQNLLGGKTSLTLKEATTVKRELGKRVFKKGKYNIPDDPIREKAKELLDLRIRDEIEKYVPEIRKYNQGIHDLINIQIAARDAAKRVGNWNKITLTDNLVFLNLLTGGSLAGNTAAGGGLGAAYVIGRKALGAGRGSTAMISGGKAIQKTAPTVAATEILTAPSVSRSVSGQNRRPQEQSQVGATGLSAEEIATYTADLQNWTNQQGDGGNQ